MSSRLYVRAGLVALATVFLAACGTTDTGSSAGNADVATGGRQFATADAETAKLGTDAEPGVFPRTISHALGETVIEKKPERVIVLDGGELDDVLSWESHPSDWPARRAPPVSRPTSPTSWPGCRTSGPPTT